MQASEFEQLVKEGEQRRLEISRVRRQGYASDEDVLSNFKKMAELCRILEIDITRSAGVAMFFVVHKVLRRANMMARGIDQLEDSKRDTDLDLHNYLDLCLACEVDEKGGKE